jgi:hypothetical protein
MTPRDTITRILLVLYAVGSIAIAIPLLFDLRGAGELAGSTSGKILAAAILALALGAALSARDPRQNRTVILVLIVFMALAAVAILWRLLFHHEGYAVDPAWMVLPVAVAGAVLLAVYYPRPPDA